MSLEYAKLMSKLKSDNGITSEKLNRCPLVNGAEVVRDTCVKCCFGSLGLIYPVVDCNFEFKINKGAEE